MTLIQRIHSHGQPGEAMHARVSSTNRPPFWVRHYDLVVNLISLGRTNAIHRETLALVDLNPGDAVLDVGCETGALVMEAESILLPAHSSIGPEEYIRVEIPARMNKAGLPLMADGQHPSKQLSYAIEQEVEA
jgi:hypothetical protein